MRPKNDPEAMSAATLRRLMEAPEIPAVDEPMTEARARGRMTAVLLVAAARPDVSVDELMELIVERRR
jgi:hypothetical protein